MLNTRGVWPHALLVSVTVKTKTPTTPHLTSDPAKTTLVTIVGKSMYIEYVYSLETISKCQTSR